MKFIVTDDIFAKVPDMYIGVVVAHNVDNHKDYPEIDALLKKYMTAAQKSSPMLMLSSARKSFLTAKPFKRSASIQTVSPARLRHCSNGLQKEKSCPASIRLSI